MTQTDESSEGIKLLNAYTNALYTAVLAETGDGGDEAEADAAADEARERLADYIAKLEQEHV